PDRCGSCDLQYATKRSVALGLPDAQKLSHCGVRDPLSPDPEDARTVARLGLRVRKEAPRFRRAILDSEPGAHDQYHVDVAGRGHSRYEAPEHVKVPQGAGAARELMQMLERSQCADARVGSGPEPLPDLRPAGDMHSRRKLTVLVWQREHCSCVNADLRIAMTSA